ncbi:hypothetical protein [Streptomyces zingiberis]|uniref:DUF4034 domain-containing protein n=1 Tax=Streptomyces zingiberis TaxID=2053010 RepID=A0ABX1C098_9ACTN|nr:hypothetical protein [Streptomyces zingiberis]NJQ01372.1 hypothetical protein [Streptomyces zingiberis]
MTPPPPPWGGFRKRDALRLDPALDDAELAGVRDALTQGRWAETRELLAGTGQDWDRRGHRLVVLGREPTSAAWAEEWRLAEPDSVDAAALHACARVFHALRGKEDPGSARAACRAAARMYPADPTPWLALLILVRHTGTDEERLQVFDQVRGRHREHHHAHHLMAASLAESRQADRDDPFHEVYDFASWAAEQAGAGSPLSALPVVAHTERYRALARAGVEPPDPARSGHWKSRRARQVMKAAFDCWLEWGCEEHPRRLVDLNFLAHAKYHEGRPWEAAALFHRIGRHVTRAPWCYPDLDPRAAYRAAHTAATGADLR